MSVTRHLVKLLAFILAVTGCGDGGSSVDDYALEIEDLVTTMNARLDELQVVVDSQPPSIDSVRAYLDGRVEARRAFVEGIVGVEPPPEAEEMHAAALDLMTRLAEAEAALASRAAQIQSLAELATLQSGPEAAAQRAVDEEAIAFCRAAEEALDTSENAPFEETAWMPPKLREVVRVAFGCTAEERAGAGS